MAKKKEKIAVFVSGPMRFVDLLNISLNDVLSNIEYDCFYHIWTDDFGNKIRTGYSANLDIVKNDDHTKLFILQKPYNEAFFKKISKLKENGSSTINATMGMFYAIKSLCGNFKNMPDFKDYTHILRLRTDCAITKKLLSLLNFKKNNITLSKNKLPATWSSDHIFFSTAEDFLKIWDFESFKVLFHTYRKNNYIPEKMLTYLIKNKTPKCDIHESIYRYRDYQIVYSPSCSNDPKWVKKLSEKRKFDSIFLNFDNVSDKEESRILSLELNKDNSIRSTLDSKILTFTNNFFSTSPILKKYIKKNLYLLRTKFDMKNN